MRWPWTKAAETEQAHEHQKEIADVTERLDDVVARVDVIEGIDLIADELAVLRRSKNGDDS